MSATEQQAGDPDGVRQGGPDPQAMDADGRMRPAFVLSFPEHPELNRLVAAFERGDFAAVRAGSAALADSEDEAVKTAAAELRRRIEPDPLVKFLLLVSFGLLAFLVLWAYR